MTEVPAAPGPEPGDESRWANLDLAWPLSLVGGFAGTWAGLATGLPGVAAVLATAAVGPLHLAFGRRGDAGAAALVTLGWALGIAGAVVGAVFEGAGAEIGRPLLLDLPPVGVPTAALHLGLFAAALLLARWSRGLGALLLAAGLVGAAAHAAAQAALSAVQAGTHAALAAFSHLPPSLTAEAVAVLMVAAALSGSGPRERDTRTRARPLLLGALGLEFLALAGWSLG